jgi:hypothetical protein
LKEKKCDGINAIFTWLSISLCLLNIPKKYMVGVERSRGRWGELGGCCVTSASAPQGPPEAVQSRYELEAGGLEAELLWLKQISRNHMYSK